MRKLMITSAVATVFLGVAACTSTPDPEPPVVVEDQSEEVVVEDVELVEVVEEVIEPVRTGPAAGTRADFQVNVGDRVYFDLDQYRLSSDAQGILRRQAAWLSSYPNVNILVAGNCDERGTREYNLALGERRASVVKNYLVDLGVDPARIQTVSYGKERPIALGSNESSWAENRNGFTQLISGVVG